MKFNVTLKIPLSNFKYIIQLYILRSRNMCGFTTCSQGCRTKEPTTRANPTHSSGVFVAILMQARSRNALSALNKSKVLCTTLNMLLSATDSSDQHICLIRQILEDDALSLLCEHHRLCCCLLCINAFFVVFIFLRVFFTLAAFLLLFSPVFDHFSEECLFGLLKQLTPNPK
ncbi:hypothetical protein CRENBAI_000922 [Crenichthys baileyi]|uniref:Uncharacterized protein n=1 Tax=Crenichthys baileyi TaxID=28760 RepID=A0AAV9RH18_9TELE